MVDRVAEALLSLIKEAVAARGRFTWALSGGGTPRPFYERLSRPPYRDAIPWSSVWTYWGDERTVPPDHPDSNYRMAHEALLAHVEALPDQTFRMEGERPPEEAATRYEKTLAAHVGGTLPVFDLVLLGLGSDGHTASLFPGTDGLRETRRWVIANAVPQLHTTRLTLTFPVLNAARRVWFLVGPDKQAMVGRVSSAPDPQWPASLVRPTTPARWWTLPSAPTA